MQPEPRHHADPTLERTTARYLNFWTGNGGWRVTTEPPADDKNAKPVKTGPHSLEEAERLLARIQNAEPGSREETNEAREARADVIEQGFISWITDASARLTDAELAARNGDRRQAGVAPVERIQEVAAAVESYTQWCRR